MRLLRLSFCANLFLALASASGVTEFYLHDGDTVVFYGDSITNQRLYTVFTETYVLTRFPRLHVTFFHSGYSGDRVSGGLGGSIDQRLEHDVFAYHPTVVTVMLGMNDGEYRAYSPEIFNKYAKGYRHLLKKLKSQLTDVRLTLLEPSAYDDVTRPTAFPGGYNGVLLQFGEFVRNLARKKNAVDADLNEPVTAVLQEANKRSTEAALDLIPDRVHPSPGIHMIMAESLLKAWHAPSVVTRVEIDATAGRLIHAENASIDNLESGESLDWRQTDRALPMPLDKPNDTIRFAVSCSDFNEALNQEVLKISGLGDGLYGLSIDGEFIASFEAGQLAAGINLAKFQTPMYRQAQSVLDLTHRHNHLHNARWRLVEEALTPYGLSNVQPTLDALDKLEAEVIALQRVTAIPKAHRYELTHGGMGSSDSTRP
jgi:lysophospholipase L1-like esterase